MSVKFSILAIGAILMTACSSPEEKVADKAMEARRYEARKEIFKECMELAAKSVRQADDDVSDIVSECGNQSYYISNGQQ